MRGQSLVLLILYLPLQFPNVFTNYPLGDMRVEGQRFIDWDHYKFTLWQTQLNFVVFCASSACSVSAEYMNAKKSMIRSIYGGVEGVLTS